MERAKRDVGISLKNIEKLKEKESSLYIRKKAHIREIARAIIRFLPGELSYEEGEEFRRKYSMLCEKMSLDESIGLCRFLVKELDWKPYSIVQKLLWCQSPKTVASFVYVKNALSDIAFEKFSTDFDRASVSYAEDFEAALEDVYYSNADYAILPIASSKTGRMQHFSELMQRYEMKAVLSCEVHSNADDSENKFLLLSKNTELRFREGDRVILEFVLSEPHSFLLQTLNAQESYGCAYESVYSNPENDSVILSLDVSKGDADAFCLYLFLKAPRHEHLGIYKKI